MGCHTWFSRPVTKEELEIFRNHAIEEAWNLLGNTEENQKIDSVNMYEFNRIKKSVEENTTYWHGWGTNFDDKHEFVYMLEGKLHLDLSQSVNPIFPNIERFHDVFRVKNYPSKKIHSRKELRKWMGKRYFELENRQLEKISEFFRLYPDGVIHFG